MMSRIRRSNAWLDKWIPRTGLVAYYLMYFAALWSLAWVIVEEPVPRAPIYEFVTLEPRLSVFVVGFILWGAAKDGIEYHKQQVFEANGDGGAQ